MVSAIAIPTKGRVPMLRRALRKHFGEVAPESEVDILVVDGSEKAEDRNNTKEAVREVEREFRRKVRYVSTREVETYVSLLEKRGIDPKVSRAVLVGQTGAARNVALLDTLGRGLLLADDDVVPTLYRKIVPATAIYKRASASEMGSDPTVFWFYPSRSEAFIDPVLQRSEEFLEVFSAYLGETVERAWGRMRSDSVLMRGDRFTGRVAAVTVGVAGDSAGLRFEAYPTLKDNLSKSNYRSAGTVSRTVVRMAVEETVQKGSFLQVNAVALDNTRDLPPFAPFETQGGLGGGSLYGRLLAATPSAYTLHRPWAVHHDPPDSPVYDPNEVYRVRTRDLALQAMEGKTSLSDIAEALLAVATVKSKEFARWTTEAAKDHANRLSSELSVRISDSSLLEVYDTSKIQIEGDGHQEQLFTLATTMKIWPDMVKAAKELQEDEIRLSVEL